MRDKKRIGADQEEIQAKDAEEDAESVVGD